MRRFTKIRDAAQIKALSALQKSGFVVNLLFLLSTLASLVLAWQMMIIVTDEYNA